MRSTVIIALVVAACSFRGTDDLQGGGGAGGVAGVGGGVGGVGGVGNAGGGGGVTDCTNGTDHCSNDDVCDSLDDNTNCGACGFTCIGTCKSGSCELEFINGGGVASVAVDDVDLYIGNFFAGQLMRMPKMGGQLDIFDARTMPFSVFTRADIDTVIWSAQGFLYDNGQLCSGNTLNLVDARNLVMQKAKSAALGDCSEPFFLDPVLSATSLVGFVHGNSSFVAWTEGHPNGAFWFAPIVNAGAQAAEGPVDTPQGVVVDDSNAAFYTLFGAGEVRQRTEMMPLVIGLVRPTPISLKDTYIYYAEWGNAGDGLPDGTLWRMQWNPIGSPEALATGEAEPGGIVVDGSYAYWTNSSADLDDLTPPSLRRVPISGGPVEILRDGDGIALFSIPAMDSDAIYWGELTTGQGTAIFRRSKDAYIP